MFPADRKPRNADPDEEPLPGPSSPQRAEEAPIQRGYEPGEEEEFEAMMRSWAPGG